MLLGLAAPAVRAGVRPPPEGLETKPQLLLHATTEHQGVTVVVSVVDLSGVHLDADAAESQQGVELTFFLGRGERGPADQLGRLPARETWDGPLTAHVYPHGADQPLPVRFERPTRPQSTPFRKLYGARVAEGLAPGDLVELLPVPGWIEEPLRWTVPHRTPGSQPLRFWGPLGAGLLVFGGLLSLAFAAGEGRARP